MDKKMREKYLIDMMDEYFETLDVELYHLRKEFKDGLGMSIQTFESRELELLRMIYAWHELEKYLRSR